MHTSATDITRDLTKALGITAEGNAVEELATLVRGLDNGHSWHSWVRRAFKLGASSVTLKELGPIDGLLSYDNEKYSIAINSRQRRTRQLFSLAHEIAHLALEKRLPYLSSNLKHRTLFHADYDRGEELIADRLAAAMLMPWDDITDTVSDHMFVLGAATSIRRQFGVSMTAAVRRCLEADENVKAALFLLDYDSSSDTFIPKQRLYSSFPFPAVLADRFLSRKALNVQYVFESDFYSCVNLVVGCNEQELYPCEIRWCGKNMLYLMVRLEQKA